MRGTRTLAVAAFVMVIGSTPLGSLLNGGLHEAWMPAGFSDGPFNWGPVKVFVRDATGLVVGIGATDQQAPASLPDDRLLVVSWIGGCSDQQIWLTFRSVGNGYRIDNHEVSNGCPLMMGIGRTVTMVTRAPIDPASVSFDASEASIR